VESRSRFVVGAQFAQLNAPDDSGRSKDMPRYSCIDTLITALSSSGVGLKLWPRYRFVYQGVSTGSEYESGCLEPPAKSQINYGVSESK